MIGPGAAPAPVHFDAWVYFALVVAASSAIWSLLFVVAPEGPAAGGAGFVALFLAGGIMPTAVAALLSYRRGGGAAVGALFRSALPGRGSARLLALAVLVPVAVAAAARAVAWSLGLAAPLDAAGILPAVVMGIAAALMEEFGWRGFALPRLRLRHGLVAASLIVGLVWAVWHTVGALWAVAPFYGALFPAYYAAGMVAVMTAAAVVVGVLVAATPGRIAVAIAFHAGFSPSAAILVPSAGSPPEALAVAVVYALIWIAAALVAAATGGRRPARHATEAP